MSEEIHAAHILVKTEHQANKLIHQLEEGDDFASLAFSYSDCPSKAEGGDLGWFGAGLMVPAFEKAAFSTKPGHIAKAKTEFGWHIIKVLGTRESED